MQKALREAVDACETGDVPVGDIVLRNDMIIGRGPTNRGRVLVAGIFR